MQGSIISLIRDIRMITVTWVYIKERDIIFQNFIDEQPRSREELFNRVHSSLLCVIERTFGVWKKRWRILQNMLEFPYKLQVKIVVASMALQMPHFIGQNSELLIWWIIVEWVTNFWLGENPYLLVWIKQKCYHPNWVL